MFAHRPPNVDEPMRRRPQRDAHQPGSADRGPCYHSQDPRRIWAGRRADRRRRVDHSAFSPAADPQCGVGGAVIAGPGAFGCGRVICGPASSASLRIRRVAAWRSIRAPRPVSRIGPLARVPVAWPMARPTAGGSGIRATLVPLPHTRSTRWPCSSPGSVMSAAVASKMRKPISLSDSASAKSPGFEDSRTAVSRPRTAGGSIPGPVTREVPRAGGHARRVSARAVRR
jgi:hypothetical protein